MFRIATICTVLMLAACATAPTAPTTAQNANTATASATKPGCATASRIPDSSCAPGSTYTQQDLQSTGVPGNNVANSLQMLDPAVHR
jgi:hypothetical protein